MCGVVWWHLFLSAFSSFSPLLCNYRHDCPLCFQLLLNHNHGNDLQTEHFPGSKDRSSQTECLRESTQLCFAGHGLGQWEAETLPPLGLFGAQSFEASSLALKMVQLERCRCLEMEVTELSPVRLHP